MKLPNKIKIGGYVYDIVYQDRLKETGDDARATVLPRQLKIIVDNTIPEILQEQAVIHEIIEEINGNNDLDLSHQAISTIAENLYQVIADNYL